MKILFYSIGYLYPHAFSHVNRKFFFLLLLAVCQLSSMAQTSALSFTPVPYHQPDIISPGRGAEQWHNAAEAIEHPAANILQSSMDVYYRFTWNRLEGAEQGSYTWDYFDGLVRSAINKGQKLSFGIMTCYPEMANIPGVVRYDEGTSAYPEYLHKLMQSEEYPDWKTTGYGPTTDYGAWVPNWNSGHYLGRLRALHEALYSHILNSSYTPTSGPHQGKTIAYKNVINTIDIRGYGAWGEWHSAGIVNEMSGYPKGTRPSTATLKRIIDHHTDVFTDHPLSIMISAFDAERLPNTANPKEVAAYALSKTNRWGLLGWRRDNWGTLDVYVDRYLKDNTQFYGASGPFNAIIMDRWKYAPVNGEAPGWGSARNDCNFDDLERQVREYHVSSIGNGNFGKGMSACAKENIRAGFKAAGYRIILESGSVSNTITKGIPFIITLDWKNTGAAPTYEKWDVVFELKNGNNSIVWSGVSRFSPGPKLPAPALSPSGKTLRVADLFSLPANIPEGNYRLNLVIKDPSGYRSPLPLAITGRNPDGSYTLKNIVVNKAGSPPAPQPPNAPNPVPAAEPCTQVSATINSTPACNGAAYDLILESAEGAGPFSMVINGTNYRNINIGGPITTITPHIETIWTNNPKPVSYEDKAIELGVRFKSASAGFVKGVRFFSPRNAAGTYSGHLWSADGELLASAVFSNVTANAWQNVFFDKPVWIEAGNIYVASYHTSAGRYVASPGGLANAISNGSSLTALGNNAGNGNGVYKYGQPGFPSVSHHATNYWADVIFTAGTYTFNLTSIKDKNGCTGTQTQTLTVQATACSGDQNKQANRSGENTTVSAQAVMPLSQESVIQKGEKTVSGLGQNYPNPFSHQTTIQYSIALTGQTNLSLSDINGRLVKVIVNSWQTPGQYTAVFDRTSLSSGVYFYTLRNGSFVETKKMIIQ